VGEPAADQDRGQWWWIFKDKTLQDLIMQAQKDNPSLQAMAARVEQARQTANAADAGLFPTLSARSDFTREQPNALTRGIAPGSALKIENSYNLGLNLGYELDLFGRVKNNRAVARSSAFSTEATERSMILALQADVAQMYFTLRALDAEIALLQKSVSLRDEEISILKNRLAAGMVNELDIASATVEAEATRRSLQSVQQSRNEMENALAVLVGVTPSAFSFAVQPLTAEVPQVPAGLPSALLERRPDISAAQFAMASANAQIGLTKSAFFPNLSLTGAGGFEAATFGKLFEWSARSWAIGPLLSLPIFSGGRDVAVEKRAEAAYAEAIADYRGVVLNAFRDVEDTLSLQKTLAKQAESQKLAERAARRAADIATRRKENGDLGVYESVIAERSALEVEREGLRLQGQRLAAAVRLVRALGGGWEDIKAP
jgi:multidrug efflux system outer membrane protein